MQNMWNIRQVHGWPPVLRQWRWTTIHTISAHKAIFVCSWSIWSDVGVTGMLFWIKQEGNWEQLFSRHYTYWKKPSKKALNIKQFFSKCGPKLRELLVPLWAPAWQNWLWWFHWGVTGALSTVLVWGHRCTVWTDWSRVALSTLQHRLSPCNDLCPKCISGIRSKIHLWWIERIV